MGFDRRKMEDQRRLVAEQAAASRRATDAQVLEDAERVIGVRNERQAKRMPMLFLPTIGAAVPRGTGSCGCAVRPAAPFQAVDLRTLDRHPWSALTGLIPALSCRSCRPHAPFAELICLSDKSIADELREDHSRRMLGK